MAEAKTAVDPRCGACKFHLVPNRDENNMDAVPDFMVVCNRYPPVGRPHNSEIFQITDPDLLSPVVSSKLSFLPVVPIMGYYCGEFVAGDVITNLPPPQPPPPDPDEVPLDKHGNPLQ